MRAMLRRSVFRASHAVQASAADKIISFTDADRDRITKELTKGNRRADSIRWQRFKGLGEMNVQELAECALDPGTRILRRITMADAKAAKQAAEMFEILMGNDVASRKEYLVKNSALFEGPVDI